MRISRSLKRFNSVILSSRKAYTDANRAKMVGSNSRNDFVTPMWPNVRDYGVNYNQPGEFGFWLQIGLICSPSLPIRTHDK